MFKIILITSLIESHTKKYVAAQSHSRSRRDYLYSLQECGHGDPTAATAAGAVKLCGGERGFVNRLTAFKHKWKQSTVKFDDSGIVGRKNHSFLLYVGSQIVSLSL